MKYKIIIYLSILAIIGACKPEVEEFIPSSGTADFARFVSTGDSYASGFADGAIYQTAQENSYANIIASKLATTGGSDFKQPILVSKDGRGVGFQPTQQGLFFTSKYVLGYRTDCLGATSLGPVLADPTATQQELQAELLQPVQGPFNNTGVPGTKIGAMLFPGYASLNPYFGRFAPGQMATVLEATLQVDPTFYALWIGNYDVMGYAISGGEGDVITDPGVFTASLNAIMDGLAASGAKGAVANIPMFKDIPYFTTVPINALQLTQELADQLNQGYAAYNQGAAQMGVPEINFQAGYNYWVIQDTSSPYNMLGSLRQIRDGEYLLMSVPQDSLKCAMWGSMKPIPGRYTLIGPEVTKITTATLAFNDAIENVASTKNAALVDVFRAFDMLARTGYTKDGITLTNEFVSGNAFSLDGLHLTGQGNAFVANLFIEKINGYFNASVPQANLTDYPSVTYP